ncbi:MAG: NUDIX hydrolase [Gordonibacter sp.]|uniref:NUDIX hydrolase n=1 Tax=Gordonibacter sp. TaxID=1968902 RepID=UPI002FC9EF79
MGAWRSGEMLEVPMDEALARTHEAYRAGGAVPAVPRLAATVMLVRRPCEVFMLRRASTMAFVPEAVVFPGGSVDPRDADERLPWTGPQPSVWAQRMGTDAQTAQLVVTAAAREVFEECGVLLAGEDNRCALADVSGPMWAEERQCLVEHRTSLAEVLARHGLVLRTDLLGLRSHWLTPEFEPRRYDTYFFAACLPAGQMPDSCTTEANGAGWADPRQMLERGAEGALRLVPPTSYNLAHLASSSSLDAFVQGVGRAQRIMLEPLVREVLSCLLP